MAHDETGEKCSSDAISVPVVTASDPLGSRRMRPQPLHRSCNCYPLQTEIVLNSATTTSFVPLPHCDGASPTTLSFSVAKRWSKAPDSKSGGRNSKIASVFLEMG